MKLLMTILLLAVCGGTLAADPVHTDNIFHILGSMMTFPGVDQMSQFHKVILAELVTSAEFNELNAFIDKHGFPLVLSMLDELTQINATIAHKLEEFLMLHIHQETHHTTIHIKRDLIQTLTLLMNTTEFWNLPHDDQEILKHLIVAAEGNQLDLYIHLVGYDAIIKVLHDISTPTMVHLIITYMEAHLANPGTTPHN
ncbi:hypothetical protein CHS0354_005869 [Potamilus streckersoni]|uniref:Uncharacterized protein n=1 Tax=Potamilus streckersoni TaxID=2493646 RepID=A0AAE0W9U3_9BIVA|nr:hypothetical protein CHS0354_005869 [Potamilus streckersoni]